MAESSVNLTRTNKATVAAANASYTANGVEFRRTVNVLQVKVKGFKSLPAGGNTTICTIPTGFRPESDNIQQDVVVGSDNTLANPRVIRMRVESSGAFKVYNYGAALTCENFEASAIFILA